MVHYRKQLEITVARAIHRHMRGSSWCLARFLISSPARDRPNHPPTPSRDPGVLREERRALPAASVDLVLRQQRRGDTGDAAPAAAGAVDLGVPLVVELDR